MIPIVHAPYRVVGGHGNGMGIGEQAPLTPGTEHVTLRIEYDHRVIAPIEDVDVVFRIHIDRCGLFVKPTFREFAPILSRHLIDVLTCA